MRLTIISGGQTGADRGGLEAARLAGLETAGWAPRGYLTEDGPDPSLAAFGLREARSTSYPERTRANVREADACVWFGDPSSAGGRLTLRECQARGVPVLVVEGDVRPWDVADWLRRLKRDGVRLLVAGDRESESPGVHDRTLAFLVIAFGMPGVGV